MGQKILGNLFNGRPHTGDIRLASDYVGITNAQQKSSFNSTYEGVRIGKNMVNLICQFVLDDVVVAQSRDGNIIYVERRSTQYDLTYCCTLNKSTGEIACAQFHDNGTVEAMNEAMWKYNLIALLPVHFVQENPEYAKYLQNVIASASKTGKIAASEDFDIFWDACYFWASRTQSIWQQEKDDVQHLSSLPKDLIEVNDTLGIKESAHPLISVLNNKTTEVKGQFNAQTEIEKIEGLRTMLMPLTSQLKLSAAQKAKVPKKSELEGTVLIPEAVEALRVATLGLLNGDRGRNIYLESAPGTGKTHFAKLAGYVFNLPVYYSQFSANSDEAELIGTTRAKDGVFNTSAETALMEVIDNCGIFVGDDANYAKAGVTVRLNSIMEAPYELEAADGTIHHRSQFSIILLTANPDEEGAHEMNSALLSRCEFKAQWPAIPNEKYADVIIQQSGLKKRSLVLQMLSCVDRINALIKEKGIGHTITPREKVAWAKVTRLNATPMSEVANENYVLDEDFLDPIAAAENTILVATRLPDDGDSEFSTEMAEVRAILTAMFAPPKKRLNEFGV